MANRSEVARQIIAEHRNLALAAAVVPVPVLDSLMVVGINLRMLDRLSVLFGVTFAEDRAKKIVSSLFAGAASGALARRATARTALKLIPGLGSLVGGMVHSAAAAAATHVVGHLFLEHFQSGGNLSDFDLEVQKPAFDREIKKVRDQAGDNDEEGQIQKPGQSGKVATARGVEASADDLRKIEGIGPKIASLLENAGICTWAALASSSPEALREILDQAGPRYRMHDPTTWPQQAAFAADGAWDELDELQQELRGGRSRA